MELPRLPAAMSWHKPSKRQRAEELGLITPLGRRPEFGNGSAETRTPSRDLFELLADRAAAKSGRDAELHALQRAQEKSAMALEDARLEIGRLQVRRCRSSVVGGSHWGRTSGAAGLGPLRHNAHASLTRRPRSSEPG